MMRQNLHSCHRHICHHAITPETAPTLNRAPCFLAVRQLRVLRAFRSFKMVAKFGSLKVIITTILETFSSIGNIMLLLLMMMCAANLP